LYAIYQDVDGERAKEVEAISTGDPFEEFYKQYNEIKDFHRRYPNEAVENLERAYKRRAVGDGEPVAMEVDSMFTGEERYGRFFDLTMLHEKYLNLPGVKGTRRMTYLQYLDSFDIFVPPTVPLKTQDKMTDAYFQYLGDLVSYLEGFMHKTRPLEDLDRTFESFRSEFEVAWENGDVPGWEKEKPATTKANITGDGQWCDDCQKEFKNPNVYNHHLTQKKHLKAVEARKTGATNGASNKLGTSVQRIKEKAIADREFRIKKLTAAMGTERSDTRINVERKQGMTDRERQQELDALMAEDEAPIGRNDGDSDSDDDEKIYNPMKLPLAWDGKPIPFWLYKLHGLGVELSCEICGNFVYMGRRAFDKHFNEARHIHGLKCLGITNTSLFREITVIRDAEKLWNKISQDKKKAKGATENVVQMEDAEGNVMPEKVYNDLRKQGLL
jgi:splicing factor 3A subunit 3